ncbi:aromatic amino acid lyase [Mariniflexile sp.]|uniref:aromatic amino acid lyase n=1 Tax=Mariniflexile sp. TaxID=1979402 RepID=UPI00404844D1
MSAEYHIISHKVLDLNTINSMVSERKKFQLSGDSSKRIVDCRRYLDEKLKTRSKPLYGINTGFGALYNVKISKEDLTVLQENLVRSHACGTGKRVPNSIVKLMLLFKIQALGYGHSGIQLETVLRLIDFYNNSILPIVFTQGSLGASGDLVPLAHLSLPLIGKGNVIFNRTILKSNSNKIFVPAWLSRLSAKRS